MPQHWLLSMVLVTAQGNRSARYGRPHRDSHGKSALPLLRVWMADPSSTSLVRFSLKQPQTSSTMISMESRALSQGCGHRRLLVGPVGTLSSNPSAICTLLRKRWACFFRDLRYWDARSVSVAKSILKMASRSSGGKESSESR